MPLRLSTTWATAAGDVLGMLLTGLSTATATAVSATDSILSALGKLQAQANLKAPLASPAFTGTASHVNLTATGTVSGAGFTSLLSPYAPLASPTLTGTPAAPTPAIGTNSTQLATTAALFNAMTTSASIVTTGGTTTLTATQYGCPILLVTGALTSNAILVVPNAGLWCVANRTTGAYSLTVKTSAGAGVVVAQSNTQELLADGTNVVISRTDLSLVTLNGLVTPSGGTTARALPVKLSEGLSVKDFGAAGDGVTNDQAAIQAAIAYVGSIGGGTLFFPAGDYAIATGLVVSSRGVRLRGAGRGSFHDTSPYNPGATRLLWTGATDTTSVMLQFKPAVTSYPANDSRNSQKLTDVGCTDMALVGTPGYTTGPSCAYGLQAVSCQHSTFDVQTVEFTVAAVSTSVAPCSEAANCEGLTISVRYRQENTAGTAVQLGGDGVSGNTCFCFLPFVYGYTGTGLAMDFGDCDNNVVEHFWNTCTASSGTPRTITFRGQQGSTPGVFYLGGARGNTIEHLSMSYQATPRHLIYSEGTETANVTVPAYSNRAVYFDTVNMPINSQVGTGATFFWGGNKTPTGVRGTSLTQESTTHGYVELSDGTTFFWGSTPSLTAGSSSSITLSFFCAEILDVSATPYFANGVATGYACCYDYGPYSGDSRYQSFLLYAPASGVYTFRGVCIVN